MALSGLDIYKHLPKTNCKECGFPTCLAFAMQVASKKIGLDKCPHVKDEAKQALESASSPPIKLITIGRGEDKLELGNETVLFRHEETFYHAPGIGFLIKDTLATEEIKKKIEEINKLKFERVGQEIKVDLIALENTSSDKEQFKRALRIILDNTHLHLILSSRNPQVIKDALADCKDKHPLIYAATKINFREMAGIAKEYSLPLAVKADSLEELSNLSKEIASLGVSELILEPPAYDLIGRIADLTHIRRLALKKNDRSFGYPTICFIESKDPFFQVLESASLIAKYSGIIILETMNPEHILPLLTVRQNIYTDPQKPLQVEPKIYEIGKVTDKAPVLVTTNFSLTYYTVESEVEASKVPAYIISVDCEGMSVLTAWAAEKFTPEKIAAALNSQEVIQKVSHKNVVIPGYVAVISGKLEEESGWKVIVGPREASGIPSFLKSNFSST
jgi:acetyl-CoA decarbonylase/synthase complex subunit gamma